MIMKYLLAFVTTLLLSAAALADDDNTLNVYNWSDYISDDVIQQFQKETGIHVNYSTYDSNETMYAKIKANPDAGYDIVVPSTYFVDRMRHQHMLLKLDKSKLSNFKNLNPALLNKPYDPNNQYSIPYLASSTGIVYNDKYFPVNSITKWADLWQPQYHDKLLLLDDVRDVFSMALLALGFSPDTADPEQIKTAYNKLLSLLPNVKLFNDEAVKAIYIDEDATVGMGWSGDIYLATKENPHLHFVYPQEGFVIAQDSMAIPIGAKHIESAYRFINFLLRPDIAAKISMSTGYMSPNLAAVKLMPEDVRNNQIIYPSTETLKRGHFQLDVGDASNLYEKYLELLKIGA